MDNKFTSTWRRTVETTGFQAMMFMHRVSGRTLKAAVIETVQNEVRKRADNSIEHQSIDSIAFKD